LIKNNKKPQNNDQTNVLIPTTVKVLYGSNNYHDSKEYRGVKKVKRRSVTFDDQNEQNLDQFRGRLLAERNKELDFTSAVNMVLALGFNRLASKNIQDDEYEIINNYVFGYKLKMASLDDEHWNTWIEYEYPRMIKRLERLEKKTQSDSVKRKKKDDVPEA
jgi:hypothetical protein